MRELLRRGRHHIQGRVALLTTALSELSGAVPPVNNDGFKSTESPEKNFGPFGNTREARATSASVLKARVGDGYR